MQPVKYLVGRVKRLWPPYLAAWLIAGIVILATTRFPTWWTHGASLPQFHWSDWVAQVGIVYLGKNAYSFAWWSLSVEVLFYLLVPLIVVAIMRTRLSHPQLSALFIAAIALALAATNLRDGTFPATAWPLVRFCTYASCFTAGVILARYDCNDKWGWLAISLGIPYCLLAFRFPRLDVHIGWGLFYFGIVIFALSGVTRLKRWLSTWLLVWIGERSYSLFLVHYSVITAVSLLVSLITTQKGARYFLTTRLIEIPLVLISAMLLFSLIERRFAKNLATGDYFWPSLSRPQAPTPLPLPALEGEALSVVVS
jgi:peptidoglycan/LPS O-acetylase OafA/YrhL